MSKFFIDRPIFAWVIALVIMLAGGLSLVSMPVNQYPSISAPAIGVSVVYPGASAETVQDTVVQVIEQQMNGIDNLRYMSSQSNSDGSMTITVTFEQGTDPDIAQVQVQNKLQLATPLLPMEVQQQGIRVVKSTVNFLMVVGLVSTNGTMTNYDLSNYIVSNMQDSIARTQGVGDFQVFGAQYSMRIWLNPSKLNNYKLTPIDVSNAIKAQNIQVSSGQLGGLPALQGTQLNATIVSKTRLQTPEEFGNILLKVQSDGSQVRLKDVTDDINLGGESYAVTALYNGNPASGIALKLATGANALNTAKAVRATVAELEPFFPDGVKVVYPYDSTPVISASITMVVHTLFEAIVLVFLVMFLFLQNFRATLIPTIAVPVVLLGTFGVLAAFGFSINTLTMFAMVLAIGLLVDDAIVVVENVERVMQEEKLPPKEAAKKSMDEIQGALVGIAMVLSAVFVPMAFLGGATGIIYRQFSITIVSAMVLSVLVALILTPALCATMLSPPKEGDAHGEHKKGFFGWFNRTFEKSVKLYVAGVAKVLKNRVLFVLLYAGVCVVIVFMFRAIPTEMLPQEDQKVLFAMVQTPAGTPAEETQKIVDEMRETILKTEANNVDSVFTVTGFSFAGRGQSSAIAFVMLKDWDQRSGADQSVQAISGRLMRIFFTDERFLGGQVFAVVPPAVMELGNSGGVDMFLQDQGGIGHEALMEARNELLGLARKSKILNPATVRPNGMDDEPQYKIYIDEEQASVYGIALSDIYQTLSIAWGSSYINDFIDRGRVKKVYVQASADARMTPEDFKKWYVRNNQGEMVPLANLVRGEWIKGSPKLERYNGVPAVEIIGEPAEGYSSGDAMNEMERLVGQLSEKGVGFSWTGLSYEEKLAGAQELALYALAGVVVFLCLAALYESWAIPFAVILVAPLGILGVVVATELRGLTNDVFFKVGLLTTIGLVSKNAILIVEFAQAFHENGKNLVDAALEACRMRIRPIVMTSLAFILGVVPLAITSGAGAGSAHSIGTGVVGGMLSATTLAIFWIPLFYVLVSSLFRIKTNKEKEQLRHEHLKD
ncbi:efflux RND transporter permease subunit [Entomomonas asaccharolytica]|uniref:Efflux pump membrane transporter n=1 Tax=Entomomonas asaccharolytica TaxID=2785331 RepID=A0A974RWY4_9GAMM|nr:efflux RND transporter permease subunit [Entomomonas asaccharolytica]QQP85627.1 efflux RND transporter permease subunit [Entomomonas asaccharolytica]